MNEINRINDYLVKEFGYFDTVNPNWRVVWSEDQLEKRRITHTKEGLALLYPEVMEVPKYRQYIHHRYILERCLPIMDFVETDLVAKFSYEPVWVFQDKHERPLPPTIETCKIIIDSVYQSASNIVGAKYKDPEIADPKNAPEIRLEKIKKLEKDLFGEDTVGPLEHGGGVFLDSTKQLIN